MSQTSALPLNLIWQSVKALWPNDDRERLAVCQKNVPLFPTAQCRECENRAVIYESQINFESGRIIGFEALIGQQDEYSHGYKLAFVEELRERQTQARWVLRTAAAQLSVWHHRFPSYREVNLNITLPVEYFTEQLDLLVADLTHIFSETSLLPRHFQLGIKEWEALKDIKQTTDAMTKLKELGVRLAIDECSGGKLADLRQYVAAWQIDALRVNRSMVRQMFADQEESAGKLAALGAIGREMSLEMIAEGVGSARQLDRLRCLGFTSGQGFLFPTSNLSDEIERLLKLKKNSWLPDNLRAASSNLLEILEPFNDNTGHSRGKDAFRAAQMLVLEISKIKTCE